MEYRRLGRTGLKVSTICLGTMQFGWTTDEPTAHEIMTQAVELGCNFFDTADVYSRWAEGNPGGVSEEIIGTWLAKGHVRRTDLIIATKVRGQMSDDVNDKGLSRHHILNAVEDSLRRLQTDYIDLYQVHAPDSDTPQEETMRALDDLVRSGKVRYLGCSNYQAWQLMKSLGLSDANGWVRFIAAQYQYSLVVRDIEPEFTDLCLSEGVGITPWGPLGGGFLTGKYQRGSKPQDGRISMMSAETEETWDRRNIERNWDILDVTNKLAAKHQVTVSQIAIAWLLAQPAVASVIVGVRTLEQLEDNLGAINVELAPEELKELDQVSTLEDNYPYRFINHYGARKELQQKA